MSYGRTILFLAVALLSFICTKTYPFHEEENTQQKKKVPLGVRTDARSEDSSPCDHQDDLEDVQVKGHESVSPMFYLSAPFLEEIRKITVEVQYGPSRNPQGVSFTARSDLGKGKQVLFDVDKTKPEEKQYEYEYRIKISFKDAEKAGLDTGWLNSEKAIVCLFPTKLGSQALADQIEGNEFATERGLIEYVNVLGADFLVALQSLTGGHHWFDGGAGQAMAHRQYLTSQLPSNRVVFRDDSQVFPQIEKILRNIIGKKQLDKARLTAVSYKVDPDPELNALLADSDHKSRFKMFKDERYIEDISQTELTEFGKVDLVTDVAGAFAYSLRPDIVLQKYLDILNKEGSIYIALGGEHSRLAEDNTVNTNSGAISIGEWVKTIPGIKATILKNEYGYYSDSLVLKIKKDRDVSVQVPKLELVVSSKGKPPIRHFVQK